MERRKQYDNKNQNIFASPGDNLEKPERYPDRQHKGSCRCELMRDDTAAGRYDRCFHFVSIAVRTVDIEENYPILGGFFITILPNAAK